RDGGRRSPASSTGRRGSGVESRRRRTASPPSAGAPPEAGSTSPPRRRRPAGPPPRGRRSSRASGPSGTGLQRSTGRAVQVHHAAGDQRPLLAQHFHPQLVAPRRSNPPTPHPAV